MNTAQSSTRMVIDPVCGMAVDPKTTDLVFTSENKDYYFCAEACRKAFEKEPQKYLCARQGKRKGFWRRYLDRLNKATDGKAMKCH